MLDLAAAIGYPERVADDLLMYDFRVDGFEIIAEKLGARIVLKHFLDRVGFDDLPTFASYAAGRLLREEAVLSWDERAQKAFVWCEIPATAAPAGMKESFEAFVDSCEWWRQRAGDDPSPESVFPDILIRP
jgi:hypothetical protein